MRPGNVKAHAPRARRPHIALVLLLGAAGCIPGGGGGLAAPSRTGCATLEHPQILPEARQIVDAGALLANARALAPGVPAGRGDVLLSLEFDPEGINVRRDVVEHGVAPAVADSVQRLVFAARRQLAPATEPWGVRLRVSLGDSVALGVERRVYCPPRPRDREVEWMTRELVQPGTRYRAGRRERSVLLRLLIHPAGYVESARVYRGGASGGDLERELFNFVRQYSFHPATLDGRPVPGEITFPVRVSQ